jgi:short-subunit dehydrogenase
LKKAECAQERKSIMSFYTGKMALITGASSGIGAAFARTLAAQGAHLILVARSQDKLRDLATTLASQHDIRAEVLAVDLSRPAAGQQLFAATQQMGLSIDMLINNAGFATLDSRLNSCEARWGGVRAITHGNRVIPIYKPLDANESKRQ